MHTWNLIFILATAAFAQNNSENGLPAGGGPYLITFFNDAACTIRPMLMRCRGLYSGECCERPPGSDRFLALRATSSGPPGVVVFSEVLPTGECGTCTGRTEPINTCLYNQPFKTTTIYRIPSCRDELRRDTDAADAVSAAGGNSTEFQAAANKNNNTEVGINEISLAGRQYFVDDANRAEMVADAMAQMDHLEPSRFAEKWQHMDVGEDPETLVA
jgi:hypothetical protein